jgi:hypothetical protein
MRPIELEFLCDVTVKLAPVRDYGSTGYGSRRYVEITGGRFEGPKFKGVVLPGGADWPRVSSDGGMITFDPRYSLETNDGAFIYLTNPGIRRAGPDADYQNIKAMAVDDPEDVYFRTMPSFETGDERYSWLNRSIFIGTGRRFLDAVEISFYEVI